MSQSQGKEERKRSIAEKARTSVLRKEEEEAAVREAAAVENAEAEGAATEGSEVKAAAAGSAEAEGAAAEDAKVKAATAGSAKAEGAAAEDAEVKAAAGSTEAENIADQGKTEPTEPPLWETMDTENGIRLDLQVDQWDVYTFMMYHSYCSVTGVIGMLLSLFCLGQGVAEIVTDRMSAMTAVLLVVGIWFTIISPLTMIGKAALQIKRVTSLQKPITYTFTEEGMLQEQGEVKTGCRWKQISKAVFMKRIWILYAGKVRGNVIPVRQLGEHEAELKRLIKAHTGKRSSEY